MTTTPVNAPRHLELPFLCSNLTRIPASGRSVWRALSLEAAFLKARVIPPRARSFGMTVCGVVVVEDLFCPGGTPSRGRVAALEHVANRPIADHVVEVLEAAEVTEIVVVSSQRLAPEIEECLRQRDRRSTARMRFVSRAGPFDLASALTVTAPIVGEAPCIVHLASGLLGEPLTPFLNQVRSDAADLVVMVHQSAPSGDRLTGATQHMLGVAELDPSRAALGVAGVWLFGPGALRYAEGARLGVAGEVDLTGVASRLKDAGGRLQLGRAESWRRYAGDPLDLLELNRIALDQLRVEPRRTENGNRIEGRVWISDRASVRSSVIVGPTVIGPGARITDSYIGPYTSIDAEATVEGSEIERSIIAAGASIMHVGSRLAASVVGRDARVFRDFSLPKALRLRVGEGTEVAVC